MWYIVLPGDSLFIIAKRFGTSVASIQQANKLRGSGIDAGQSLFIPLGPQKNVNYTVMPGDTLFRIAQLFNTTVNSIILLNNLPSTVIYAGATLRIPIYSEVIVSVSLANVRNGPGTGFPVVSTMRQGARLPVTGYQNGWYRVGLYNGNSAWISGSAARLMAYDGSKPIQPIIGFYTLPEGPGLPGSYLSFSSHTGLISEVGLFMWQINRDDPTGIVKFGQFTDQEVNLLVSVAHQNNIKILPVVHNLLYRPGGTQLAKDLVRQLVSTPENRSAFAQNLVNLIEQYNFDGVNIDIEDAYTEDSQQLAQLYVDISEAFKPGGYMLSASVPSRVSDEPFNPFSDPFDYGIIGNAVDQFVVMLYNEYGWPGSPPGPAVSLPWMRRVINYTKTKMPWYKIAAAVSVFGFDFNLDTGKNSYLSYNRAVSLANQYNQDILFSEQQGTPYFRYTSTQGERHEVWFENSRSIREKIQLAWQLSINGVALWRLGMEDESMWNMIANNTVVKKYLPYIEK